VQAHAISIKGWTELKGCNWFIIEENTEILSHFSLPHVGAEILSVSKRIMNIPLMLAEDNGLSNYYIDTDSMHVTKAELPRLEELFKNRMGFELLGDDFGQFKCDFEMKDARGRPCHDVESVEFMGCGKKCYLDMLRGLDPDGEEALGFHARIKGCSVAALNAKAAKVLPDRPLRDQVRQVYRELLDGNMVRFNLLSRGPGAKLGFKANKDFTTTSRDRFKRRYTFPGPVNYGSSINAGVSIAE
jgi:hypothetical protein